MNFQVAVDGPAGSGKSSISKAIASILHFNHIDTGAMYRAVTLAALKHGIDLENDSYDFVDDLDIYYENGSIYLNGEVVDELIRNQEVSNSVSIVARAKRVRESMVKIQRKAASKGNVIMDGRDIGYVVLPNAELKLFLNASVEVRAKRRYMEINDPEITLAQLMKEIETRDKSDSTRALNPLRKAEDAIEIDTTNMSFDEVVTNIIELIKERGKNYGVRF